MRKRSLFLAAGACLAAASLGALSLTVGRATADPTGPPTFRALVGVGDPLTQDVMNAMSNTIRGPDGTLILGSYDSGVPPDIGSIGSPIQPTPTTEYWTSSRMQNAIPAPMPPDG